MSDDLFIVTVVPIAEMDDATFYKHYILRHDAAVRPITSGPCGATDVTRAFHDLMHRKHQEEFDHDHEEMS